MKRSIIKAKINAGHYKPVSQNKKRPILFNGLNLYKTKYKKT
jgi:hypothetical protein